VLTAARRRLIPRDDCICARVLRGLQDSKVARLRKHFLAWAKAI